MNEIILRLPPCLLFSSTYASYMIKLSWLSIKEWCPFLYADAIPDFERITTLI